MPVGQLVPARDAYSSGTSFLDPSNLTPVDAAATLAAPGRWWGQLTVDAANLRSAPSRSAPSVGQLPAGSPLVVTAWVAGDQIIADNPTWGQINDNTFIYRQKSGRSTSQARHPHLSTRPKQAAGSTSI